MPSSNELYNSPLSSSNKVLHFDTIAHHHVLLCHYLIFGVYLECFWKILCMINLMYNISMRVLNIFWKKNLRCLLLLKCTHLIYLKNIHSINVFNYFFLKIHGNTCQLNFWSWHYNSVTSHRQNMFWLW